MQALFSWIAQKILSLRYRVEWKGFDPKLFKRNKGTLFLSNHPSQLDPLFIWLQFSRYGIFPRPVVVEYIYRIKWLLPFFQRRRAVPIPNFDNGINSYKMATADRSLKEIKEGLKKGDSFLIYPAGRLKKTAKESLGGASGTFAVIQECPDADVWLIRMSGLWGSSFSRALTSDVPDLQKGIWKGIKAVLKNGIFFSPRRKILIEVEAAPRELVHQATKMAFNRCLENWFNQGKEELLIPIPLTRPNLITPLEKVEKTASSFVASPDTQEAILEEMRRILNAPDLTLSPEQSLATDLGMDSLNVAELSIFLTRQFGVKHIPIGEMETVADLFAIAEKKLRGPIKKGTHTWPTEQDRGPLVFPSTATLPEALFAICCQKKSLVICGDDRRSSLTYTQYWRAVFLLAERFKKFPEKHVAILLPASIGTYIIFFGLQLAGKVPVMLNWTLGPRYLEEMVRLSSAERILTSWEFIDHVTQVDFGTLHDRFVFLEDLRKTIPFSSKLKVLFSRPHFSSLSPDDTAVILFTSGTEASPKGVPLSHSNILSNLKAVLEAFPFESNDIPLCTLPPFHSLGLTVCGLYPLLIGMRSPYFPDPTDSFSLAEAIVRWQVTHVSLPPTFLRQLLAASSPEQLRSVKVFFCGGDKAPRDLIEQIQTTFPHAAFVEGYGVTECAPCIAMGHPTLLKPGDKKILPGIEVRTIHPETKEPLPEGAEGEICVRGPNLFKGYLIGASPFLEIEGKSWYPTGDIGKVETGSLLILSGRLKRFAKIGGEMISLGAIEETLAAHFKDKGIESHEPLAAVALHRMRNATKPLICVYSKVPIRREETNELLKKKGFSNLIKVDEVRQVVEIPLLRSGKIDYRSLEGFS